MPFFRYDERLGIPVPRLAKEWEMYSAEEQFAILTEWEEIRGRIPDRIMAFERLIIEMQERLGLEDSFDESCRLNGEISELASRVNDLNIWFRTG
ncbi:hypothetical protein [Gorillibacterium sp. sgz5001074]|uniref:hypothetical protein n=1 Tax=Gorillibacterium sp. sgz5001074 TaxID=3446695 RepID=UPI003F6774DB